MDRIVVGALLSAAACGAAAQPSVTLYGIVDTGFSHGKGSIAKRDRLSSGSNASSRIGLRGVEDLGGGLSASFTIDGALTTDDGQGQATNTNNQASGTGSTGPQGLTFNRRSTLSLLGPWGELRAGRDLAAHYLNKLGVDPFNNIGVGAAQPLAGSIAGPTGVRVSNMVGYYFERGGQGFHGIAQYFMGENPGNGGATAHDGTGAGARLGYKAGPLDVTVGYGKTEYAQTRTAGDIRTWNAALAYQSAAGMLVGAGYYVDRVEATAPVTARGWVSSANIRRGGGEFKLALSRYGTDAGSHPTTRKLALGYVHWMSKRTALYATYARVRNAGGAAAALNQSATAPGRPSSGFDLGIRHNF